MFNEHDIDFSPLDGLAFEQLVLDLLHRLGFSSLVWRQGGADQGRDIEATLTLTNPLLGTYQERWFVEAKHLQRGVGVAELQTKIA